MPETEPTLPEKAEDPAPETAPDRKRGPRVTLDEITVGGTAEAKRSERPVKPETIQSGEREIPLPLPGTERKPAEDPSSVSISTAADAKKAAGG